MSGLLHLDLLFCLDEAGLLDDLVFQGGTSLRLCYGANRLSEDLGFAGGKAFNVQHLTQMKSVIEHYIGKRYGLEVDVKEPKQLREDPKYAELAVHKWQIAITTAPARKDVPKQRIKIEVANVPAYTKQPRSLLPRYDFLPDGYNDTLVYVETLDEVMADKLVSYPATRRYVRYRDIWDLAWLKQQGATPNVELVRRKLADYQLANFEALLAACLDELPAHVHGVVFHDEMRRFIPQDVYSRTLAKAKFLDFLEATVKALFSDLQRLMYASAPTIEPSTFRL